jgi:hypothetical protein
MHESNEVQKRKAAVLREHIIKVGTVTLRKCYIPLTRQHLCQGQRQARWN